MPTIAASPTLRALLGKRLMLAHQGRDSAADALCASLMVRSLVGKSLMSTAMQQPDSGVGSPELGGSVLSAPSPVPAISPRLLEQRARAAALIAAKAAEYGARAAARRTSTADCPANLISTH